MKTKENKTINETFNYSHIHFIGIGGAGMTPLAIIAKEKGFDVSGSDIKNNANIDLLKNLGITIFLQHSHKNISDKKNQLIVRSSAVKDSNLEYQTALKAGHKCLRRGEMLAEIAKTYKNVIAVTGTHGKTSVTALIVHIAKKCNLNPGFMVGGKINSYSEIAAAGDGSIFICESDESDGTQIYLHSNSLIVTNIEDDHSWTLGGNNVLFANFAKIAENADEIIYNESELSNDLFAFHQNKQKIVFNKEIFSDKNDWGDFQKENANIAVQAALNLGINYKQAMCEVRTFPGVARRMSLRLKTDDFIIIEDYAHHPTEIKAAIFAIRELYPEFYLKILIQPHRYARLTQFFDEFVCELRKADEIIIVPVFSAWVNQDSINSASLAKSIGKKASFYDLTWKNLAENIKEKRQNKEVLAIFGAGDVEEIIPHLLS